MEQQNITTWMKFTRESTGSVVHVVVVGRRFDAIEEASKFHRDGFRGKIIREAKLKI